MERCDFSSIMTTIRRYISEDYATSQSDLLEDIFHSYFYKNKAAVAFDMALVCRWFTGQAKVSPKISQYYAKDGKHEELVKDIGTNVLPVMYDSSMAVQELYRLLMQDDTISERVKAERSRHYPCNNYREEALFIADVLSFGMEREFVKRDVRTKNLLADGKLSPILSDFIADEGAPKPCRHFCGREKELEELHERLYEHGKIFLHGIAGIGKSELAKAYAKKHSKEYTNILYLTYSGDLLHDIAEMDFADDLPEDSEQERFRKHNRFLRTLKEDTLIIVDNFNTTASQDSTLSVVMKYRCRMLFTTRSRFDNYVSMEVTEIADKQALLSLAGGFYSEAEKHQNILEQIIETVHSHTLAVELSARLLESGIMEPMLLLSKLKEEKTSLDASDKIGITKDGRSRKATYYDHIHTLFSLYDLCADELDIMKNLVFAPMTGVSGRVFASWLLLRDMNIINDLVEKGFVQTKSGHAVALHPMIQEVSITETKPSIQNCQVLLNSLQENCLRHGEEISYYKQMFQTIENIIELIEKDDMGFYLRFIEDAFPYMQKFKYQSGMERIVDEMAALLKDKTFGTVSDRALLFDYRAALEARLEKAIKYEKDAVELLKDVTADNALLASNLHANLGGMYRMIGKQELAKQHMEAGIHILEEYGLAAYHDSVPQIVNYSVMLTEMGEPQMGMSALKKLSRVVKEYNSDKSADYGEVQEAMAHICLATGEIKQATTHYKKALAIYETVFEAEPELIEEKKQAILETYAQAGVHLGRQLLDTKR